MRITHLASSAAVIASLAFAAPAFAQHRGGGGGGGHPSGSAHAAGSAGPRTAAPRAGAMSGQRGGPVVAGRAVRGTSGYVRVAPRIVGGRYYAPAFRFNSPWYAFHSHFNLGFGLFVGYPLSYPYWAYPYYGYYNGYSYPYGYGYPYGAPYPGYVDPGYGYDGPGYPTSVPYGQPAPGTVTAQGGGVATGGLSFDISPSSAEVFIDGNDYGTVSSFSPNSAPLALTPGRHHVEIHAQGYETMQFDADVVAGQVIPYQGTMRQ